MSAVRAYFGESMNYGPGVSEFWLMLFPRRDLMMRADEGRRVLAGMHVNLTVRYRTPDGDLMWPRVHFWAWSDADEIRSRIARSVGQ